MKNTRKIAVIIVAGGSGRRMGGPLPKQFMSIGGKPILMHTIERFAEVLPGARLVLVLARNRIQYWKELCQEYTFLIPHTVCPGGETRFDSVRQGLEEAGEAELIAVHDGVRPLVNSALIERAIADARTFGAVIPVVTPVDSLREIGEEGNRIVDRTRYRIVQTPQVFHAGVIRSAYSRPCSSDFTDDASVVEAAGEKIYLCEGDYSNIKITTPIDMITAEALLDVQAPPTPLDE